MSAKFCAVFVPNILPGAWYTGAGAWYTGAGAVYDGVYDGVYTGAAGAVQVGV